MGSYSDIIVVDLIVVCKNRSIIFVVSKFKLRDLQTSVKNYYLMTFDWR